MNLELSEDDINRLLPPAGQETFRLLRVAESRAHDDWATTNSEAVMLAKRPSLNETEVIELDTLRELAGTRRAAWNCAQSVLARAHSFLASALSQGHKFADAEPVKVGSANLETLREEITALRQQRRALLSKKPSAADVKTRARALIQGAKPPSINEHGELTLPLARRAQINLPQPLIDERMLTNRIVGALYALFPDAVLDLVDQLADQHFAEGVADLDLRRQQKEVEDKILHLERQEVALCRSEGRAFRSDADPLAVLNVVYRHKARVAA